MRYQSRKGEMGRLQLILLPPALFFSGVILYNAFQWASPPAFAIEGVEPVEVLVVVDKLSPLRGNGLIANQSESISSGGSSRLIVARPAEDGPFLLVQGRVSHGYLLDKIGLNSMLHLKISSSEIQVQCNGEPVDAILLGPRKETAPLRVEDIYVPEDQDLNSVLYANQTILPAASGQVSGGTFTGDSGMSISCGSGVGKGGTGNLFEKIEYQFTLDELSTAWIEYRRTIGLASPAVGAVDWDVGFLIPVDQVPAEIRMFGEVVGTVQ